MPKRKTPTKFFKKWKQTFKKDPTKTIKKFSTIFAPKMPQWIYRLFHRWKVPLAESERKNCQRYPKIPEDSRYQGNGDRLLPKKNFTQTWQKYCISRFCDGKNDKNSIRIFRSFMWWNFQVMPTAFLSIIHHSGPKNKLKNSPKLGICGWQNNGSLQKIFSNSEIENWGKLGACPNYFLFWKGNICGCGNGIFTQLSQRVLLSFLHPSNLSANQKIGAQCSVQRRWKIAFIYKVFNSDPFFVPQ